MQNYILSIIGDDKPGLVDAVAQAIADVGGSWLESRLANLSGKFSGMVLLAVPASSTADFESRILDFNGENLVLQLHKADINGARSQNVETHLIRVVANDRPGILSQVSNQLSEFGLNVEELSTDCQPAPMSNELLFRAEINFSCPSGFDLDTLCGALEMLADDLIVELDSD